MYKNLEEFGYSRNEFLQNVKEGIVMVRFIKKNNSIRDMICTLNFNKIPKDKHPKNTNNRDFREKDNIPVFDLENLEWRSINISSIVYACPICMSQKIFMTV
jgi:hypothetical protein